MKYYDDDYDDTEAYPLNDETVRKPELQLENLRGLDWLLALILASVMGGLLTLWAFPGLSPDAWDDAAIGAGLRPMQAIFPGFWNLIARGLYSLAGVSSGTLLIKVLGRVFAGLTVGLVYLLLRQVLSITIRVRLQFSSRRFLVVRGVAVLGAIFFACSDPIWRAGQAFTPPLLLLFLTVLVATLFFSFLMSGGMRQIYLSMFLLGLLTAETPMGFFLLALVWGVYLLALRHGAVASNSPILNPVVEQSSKWHLTFLYAIGLVIGVGINCTSFIVFDGLTVFEKIGGDVPLLYATRWWTQFIHAASGLGWVLGLGIGVLPFIVTAVLLPRAVDEEQFLPYHMGAVFFVAGALAFAQLAELPPLWFWTWSPAAKINSGYFLLVLMLFSAASVVFSLAVMAVDICCRDHKRLAMQRFAELKEEMDVGTDEPADVKPLGVGARIVLVIVPALLLAAVVPGRHQGRTRRMLEIVEDYVKEILAECRDVKWIFSEGPFDSRLELEAASQGRSLRAHAMILPEKSSPERERYIRTHDMTNEEDRVTLSMSTPMTLRMLMHDHPERLSEIALQLGFELWKRDGKELPPCSGVLSRPAGMSEEERLRGVESASEIADRILELYLEGGPSKSAGVRVNMLFNIVQWRISRLARMRAEREDRAGNTNLAMKDVNLSDRLDHANASLNRILRDEEKNKERILRSVTPRESLQMALARADFTMAQRFAEPILKNDPDDPNANFGVGMNYYRLKQWARAEEYLRKCLIKRPKEPAVWNNLAMICMHTERYDEGLKLAHKALELIPESGEVKDTIKQIKEAKEKAKEEAAKTTNAAAAKPAEAPSVPPATTNAPTQTVASAPSGAETPIDVYAIFGEGMAHVEKREWDQSVKKLTRCVELKPDNPLFLNSLARALFYRGRYDEALTHAQKTLKLQPESVEVKDLINQIKKARATAAEKKNGGKKAEKKPDVKKAEKKPAGKKPPAKKPQKKPEKVENPPKPAPPPASADTPAEDDMEGLVPATPSDSETAPSDSENM